jgi:hypothetical protein
MIGAIIILMSLMKPSPSGFELRRRVGREVAEQHADRYRDQHLHVERFVEAAPAALRLTARTCLDVVVFVARARLA